jgi:hypothetical protein
VLSGTIGIILVARTLIILSVDINSFPCKILCSHGGDYEECRPLGYKTPVRTSQETHYFSATESSQLMLCKI